MREVFTVSEAAEMLGVHPVTLRGWLKEGRVKGVKYSNVWRLDAEVMRSIRRDGVPERRPGNSNTTQAQ